MIRTCIVGVVAGIVLGITIGLAIGTHCYRGEVWDWQSSMCVLKCPPTGCS